MKTFEELGLSKPLLDILKAKGFKEPSEIQEKTIPLALAGKDIIGGSATGSGKTLAFASPIIEKLKPNGEIQALIMTPTRELAEQITKSIRGFSKNKPLEILPIYGGVDIQKQIRKISTTDVVVGTPGRILDHLNRGTLRLDEVRFLVLDEVDRMFDMGFHHDVEAIIKNCNDNRQTMLFSATISSEMDHLAQKYTKDAKEVSVESFVDTSKLKQVYYDTPSNLKFSLLVHLLEKEKASLVMIFCSTKRNTDLIANNLKKIGINAEAIHGGLVQNKRTRILGEFHKKKINILVCTDVAARGLDIKDVSHVYNYDLPKTKDEYIHRIGRTARAGDKGIAINILSDRDYENFSNILRDKDIEIKKADLPFVKPMRMDVPSRGHSRGNRGERFSGGSRGRYGGRSPRRGEGRAPRRDSRRDGRAPRRSTRTDGSRSPRRSSGGGRGPRRDNSRRRPQRSRPGDNSSRNSRFRRNDSRGRKSPRRDSRRR